MLLEFSSCYQGIHTCEGDMIVICNAMYDYSEILLDYLKQNPDCGGYNKAFYEIHANRCRKIGETLGEQIGYDRNAMLEKCKNKRFKETEDDVGEEAMTLAIRKRRENEQGESHERKDIRGD